MPCRHRASVTERRFAKVSGWLFSARPVAEILEKVAVRREHDGRTAAGQGVLIGLHRAVEAEKVGVLAVSLAEDAGLLGVAFAAQDFGLARRLGGQHGHFARRAGPDALRRLIALGAVFGRFALAPLPHA